MQYRLRPSDWGMAENETSKEERPIHERFSSSSRTRLVEPRPERSFRAPIPRGDRDRGHPTTVGLAQPAGIQNQVSVPSLGGSYTVYGRSRLWVAEHLEHPDNATAPTSRSLRISITSCNREPAGQQLVLAELMAREGTDAGAAGLS